MIKILAAAAFAAGLLVAQIDPSIPSRVYVPPPPNLIDTMRRAQEIRESQARTQQIQEQTRQLQEQRRAQAEQSQRQLAATPPQEGRAIPTMPDNFRSSGLLNGRFWNSNSDAAKIDFLMGYGERAMLSETLGQLDSNTPSFPKFPVTFGEISKGLNRIYDSPENLNVPVSLAINAFQKQVSGATDQEINNLLQLARKTFSPTASTTH